MVVHVQTYVFLHDLWQDEVFRIFCPSKTLISAKLVDLLLILTPSSLLKTIHHLQILNGVFSK